MPQLIIPFLLAFAVTNALEFPFYHYFIRKTLKEKITAVLLINLVTLPLLWIALPLFFENYLAGFMAAEAAVVLAETILIKLALRQTTKNSFKIAGLANLVSAVFGLFFF